MRTGELVLCRHKIITPFKARQYLNGSGGGGGGGAEVKGRPPETTAESGQVPGQVSQLEDTVSLCNLTWILKQITEDLCSPLMENGGGPDASRSPSGVRRQSEDGRTRQDRQSCHLLNQAGLFSCLKLMAGR